MTLFHRLYRRLRRTDRDPGFGLLVRAITAPPTAAERALIAAVERDLTAPVPVVDAAGGPDATEAGFSRAVASAEPAPEAGVVLVIRIPALSRWQAKVPAPVLSAVIRPVLADRVTAALGPLFPIQLSGDGDDLVAVLWPSRLDDLPSALRTLAVSLSVPFPLGGKHAIVQPQFGLAPVRTTREDAVAVARIGLPETSVLRWTPEATPGSRRMASLLSDLPAARAALAAGRFTLLHQHIRRVDGFTVAGTRAIPSWTDETGSARAFTELGELADATRLSHHVLDHTLPALGHDLALWHTDQRGPGEPDLFCLLDVSEQILRDRYLSDQLPAALDRSAAPAELFVLGIPHTALTDVPGIDAHLAELHGLGVGLALTGYGHPGTPLSVLTRHPWQFLVIRAEIINILAKYSTKDLPPPANCTDEKQRADREDSRNTVIPAALIRTAHTLGIPLLAENTTIGAARHGLGRGSDLHTTPNRTPVTAAGITAAQSWRASPAEPESALGLPAQRGGPGSPP
ncbi:EAL domain-containing protein [Amycolatopsis minnesotensis]|uniref:EAL domain-containing protein n=1 Tax=Amycolatopsis minnesotensis TaxID=337894 RepID=A0ABP5CB02_9PSEU